MKKQIPERVIPCQTKSSSFRKRQKEFEKIICTTENVIAYNQKVCSCRNIKNLNLENEREEV